MTRNPPTCRSANGKRNPLERNFPFSRVDRWKNAAVFGLLYRMKKTSHVFEFLKEPVGESPVGICVLVGKERFLKTLAMNHFRGQDADDGTGRGDEDTDDSSFTISRFDGPSAQWSDVHDELSTRSLFGGGGPRIVFVDDADKFVSANRDRLEKYADGQGGTGLLVLVVDTWLKTTKLAKLVASKGVTVDCGPPLKSAKSKSADPTQVIQWLIERAKSSYGFDLPKQAGQLLFDLTECEFGRMDQELQKLALFADAKGKVSMEICKQMIGGWRTRTTWDAIEAALAGDSGRALDLLDLIFRGGEVPLAIFGSIAWSLRRYGNATEDVLRQVRSGRRPSMQTAIKDAGLGGWGGANAEAELKQVGSGRAKQIHQWLLETDIQLKRSHSDEKRGRLAIEKLFVKMSKELAIK